MARSPFRAFVAGLALLLVLTGCSSRTQVSLTGNAPAQYTHVWLTVKEVWFTARDSAAVSDTGWSKFTLGSPVTVDLVAANGGTLEALATSLKLVPGTYSQLRLIPLDPSATLSSSAQAAGAIYNAEADYVDAAGTTHQLPLELLNPDQGIAVHASLRVPVGKLGAGLGAAAVGAAALGAGSATNNVGTIDATNTTGTFGTGTTGTFGTGSSTTASTPTSTATTSTTLFAVDLDGTRDLVPFTYGNGVAGVMLSAHPNAFRNDAVGGIEGTLTLTNLTGISAASGIIDLQASAETLSADGSRHVLVATAPVRSDGTFVVYPLPSSSSSPASYDLVIHGAGMATIIIRGVELTLPSSSNSAHTQANGGTTTTAGTTTSTEASTTNGINTVSVGTLTPRSATPFSANLQPSGTALPSDSVVSFYQTPAGGNDVPFLIESAPIDPFNHTLAHPQTLAPGTIDTGTYASSGTNITLASAAPAEAAGTYRVAASAPNYLDGSLATMVSAPASGTQPVLVKVPAPVLAAPAVPGTVLVSLTLTTPGKYAHGQLLLSHDGALAAVASLDAALAQGGNVSLPVPAHLPSAVYLATVRLWHTPADPPSAVQRQWSATGADLRSTTNASLALTLN